MNYEEFNKGCFEEAKRLYETANAEQRYVLEKLFPELKESKDERIREWIIDTIKSVPNDSIEWDVIDKSDVIAWIEKHSKASKVEQAMREVKEKADAFTKAHKGETSDVILAQMRGEQKSTENVELSAFRDKLIELFKRFEWYCKDKTQTNEDIIEYVDAHIQELIDTIQKPAEWSEEDIKMIDMIEKSIHGERYNYYKKPIEEMSSWLKSLRLKLYWKPSDKQIACLHDAVARYNREGFSATILTSLLEQLKKLREE